MARGTAGGQRETGSNRTLRCFVAVDVGREAKAFMAGCVDEARHALPAYRFVSASNLHVTLQFLGEIDRNLVSSLAGVLENAVRDVEAFRLGLGEAGFFPSQGTPRVLYVTVGEGKEDLVGLANKVRTALKAVGFHPDRSFAPHITLGRARDRGGSGESNARILWQNTFSDFASRRCHALSWDVSEVILVESILGREGPTYTGRAAIPLFERSAKSP